MILDLEKPVKRVDGTNAKEQDGSELMLYSVLALAIEMSPSKDKNYTKLLKLAERIEKQKKIEIDSSDLKVLEDFVKSTQMAVLVAGRLEEAFEDARISEKMKEING